jgi:hypothetical protein
VSAAEKLAKSIIANYNNQLGAALAVALLLSMPATINRCHARHSSWVPSPMSKAMRSQTRRSFSRKLQSARVRALRFRSAPEIDTGIHARLVSASIVCLKMLFTLVWYPLPRFFSQAITSASSRIETACFTGR